MLLTKRNEYALQAMILLARQKEGELLPASALALALKTTPAFMSKIAQQLSGAGLVRSQKGKNGGLFLGRPAQKILVKQIFAAVDGILICQRLPERGPLQTSCLPDISGPDQTAEGPG